MRSRYTIREPDFPYFITCTVVQWIPIFTRKPYFDILIDSLQFCRQHKGLKLHAYVILDNHLHMVSAGPDLADIIRDFKSYTAKSLITRLEQDHKTWVLNQLQYYKQRTKINSAYQVWQEGSHPQQISSPRRCCTRRSITCITIRCGPGWWRGPKIGYTPAPGIMPEARD